MFSDPCRTVGDHSIDSGCDEASCGGSFIHGPDKHTESGVVCDANRFACDVVAMIDGNAVETRLACGVYPRLPDVVGFGFGTFSGDGRNPKYGVNGELLAHDGESRNMFAEKNDVPRVGGAVGVEQFPNFGKPFSRFDLDEDAFAFGLAFEHFA